MDDEQASTMNRTLSDETERRPSAMRELARFSDEVPLRGSTSWFGRKLSCLHGICWLASLFKKRIAAESVVDQRCVRLSELGGRNWEVGVTAFSKGGRDVGLAPAPAGCKWYRIRPESALTSHVHRIIGPTTEKRDLSVRMHSGRSRSKTDAVPSWHEELNPFGETCRVCFDRLAEVLALPCRHRGICEQCLRRWFFSRPAHRGGRSCPFCRGPLHEVIRVIPSKDPVQLGYSISIGVHMRTPTW
eukprot:TRINITY_DN65848_c0_g1_i1.p1 TRINITY_DN65848_c0_g1~~TRINITY_DN65848_c0_g1_i1.p1  ORF type:complete len:245 (-),score=21.20 TRINITY_DN65848_c0_g1_i1:40-774(-)